MTSQGRNRVMNIIIPPTRNTSSPDISQGNALILVRTGRYKLGALGPKFSGARGPGVPATFPFWYINHAFASDECLLGRAYSAF